MTNWKKAYTTFLFCGVALAGAAIMAFEYVSSQGLPIPPWVLPVVGAVGVFLRALPQDGES